MASGTIFVKMVPLAVTIIFPVLSFQLQAFLRKCDNRDED